MSFRVSAGPEVRKPAGLGGFCGVGACAMEERSPGGVPAGDDGICGSDGTVGRVSSPPARGASDGVRGLSFGTTFHTHWGGNSQHPSAASILEAGPADHTASDLPLSGGLGLRMDSTASRGFADASTGEVVRAMGRSFSLDSNARELFDLLPEAGIPLTSPTVSST